MAIAGCGGSCYPNVRCPQISLLGTTMSSVPNSTPTPDLRIVMVDSVLPHEEFDSQRADPLVERLQHEEWMINPPIVAPMGATHYVILDGANRCHAFSALKYPHILVQVASYESGLVELSNWQHVVCNWSADQFLRMAGDLRDISLSEGHDKQAIAHILLTDGRVIALRAAVQNTHERNAALREFVRIYQRNATLQRTASAEPREIWQLYPDAIALVIFPTYQPSDIIAAAKYQAYLPPGISRHIVHGRALRVNYPLERLRDPLTRLSEKNEALRLWLQEKLAKRQVRYYAEAVYQFDE